MAGNKYIANNAGTLTETEAIQSSAGAGDAGKIPALDSVGRFDASMMPVGVAADTASVQASEALAAGDYVNIWSSAGSFRARKADASVAGKEAHGYVLAAVSSGASATIYFEGSNTQVTGQAPGVVFLSAATPGLGATAAPSATGNTVQRIGFATSATNVNFQSAVPFVLA